MANDAAFYNDVYLTNPGKWANGNTYRDARAFELVSKHINKPARILDFGCGNGHTLEYFHSYWSETEYTGVDISEVALRIAQWHMPDALFATELPEEEWDVILSLGVIEHFIDPEVQLRLLGRHLAPGGHMYIEEPDCLAYSEDKSEGFRVTNGGSGQKEWHWKRETWDNTIRKAGFVIEEYMDVPDDNKFIWVLRKDSDGSS